jgi:hypothetical protein
MPGCYLSSANSCCPVSNFKNLICCSGSPAFRNSMHLFQKKFPVKVEE